ncbi:MAG: DUF2239 family protein [Terracidiphilus sp.]
MDLNLIRLCTAFEGPRQIASGYVWQVANQVKAKSSLYNLEPVLIFDDLTGQVIDLDLRGDVEAQSPPEPARTDEPERRPGRPKLGVVAREVTLLPRHWDWLATQPGGASVALRKLVEDARRASQGKDRLRLAREAAYVFMKAMAGNEPGFEEATRALFGGNQERFAALVEPWPIDVRNYAKKLAARGFECLAAEHTPQPKPRHTMDELLAKSDFSQPMSSEDREWIDLPPVGRELI